MLLNPQMIHRLKEFISDIMVMSMTPIQYTMTLFIHIHTIIIIIRL